VPASADQQNSELVQDNSAANGTDAADAIDKISSARIRAAIGSLYSEQFHILLYLTLSYYVLILARDIFSGPEGATILIVADFAILVILIGLYYLERRSIINPKNVYLTPIPIAVAMVINGYMHIFLSGDPLMLIKGVLMTVAFGIVSLLPWIFWLLMTFSMVFFFTAAIWMLGPDSKTVLVLGVGAAMISYGSFAMRYNSVRKQIALTLMNEERAQTLETVGKAKDQFIANISHELRTPLTGLLGMVNLIDERGLSAEQTEQLAAAKSSADTLGTIIGDLLDVSSLDAGKLGLNIVPFDLEKTVQSVVSVMQSQAREGVSLTHTMPSGGLPRLIGDASRIRQILFNLVGNAVKFTDQGEVKLNVILLEDDANLWIRFVVQDTGVGIPDANFEKLFDRFEQVDASSTRARAGTGLGLAIAQELAGLMDSKIEVESQVDVGTRFWFDLVLNRAPAEAVAATNGAFSDREADTEEHAEDIFSRPLNILVAEDNPVNQLLIGKLLGHPQWKSQVVPDGLTAAKAADESHFDIILMDIQMPEMNGETATQAIRAGGGLNSETPIIALTANCQESDIARYKEAGFSAHVGKPIAGPDFYGTIAKLVGKGAK